MAPLPLPPPLRPERAARLAGPVRRLLADLARLWELPAVAPPPPGRRRRA